MDPWIRDIIVGGIVVVAIGYIKYVVADLKSKIKENKDGIDRNEDKISNGKKELYEHLQDQYYNCTTMDAKILALKYRQDGRGRIRGTNPGGSLDP